MIFCVCWTLLLKSWTDPETDSEALASASVPVCSHVFKFLPCGCSQPPARRPETRSPWPSQTVSDSHGRDPGLAGPAAGAAAASRAVRPGLSH